MNLSFSALLAYQAPGGSQVNAKLLVSQATYTAQQAGSLDLPSGTVASLAFPISNGPVATPIGIAVISRGAAGVVYFNGQTGGVGIPLSTGGIVSVINPDRQSGGGIVSAVFATNRVQQVPGQVDFLIFGD